MLDGKELKVVLGTLTKRKAWIKNALESSDLSDDIKKEHIETLKVLESAIQKLGANMRKVVKPSHPPVSAPSSSSKSLDRARILVAEDNEESSTILIEALTDMGIKFIDSATDGIQAFDFIKKANEPYDIILCDWDMPELSGIEVHSKAKASNTLKGSHFIMVTAMTEAAAIRKAIQQGINDYVAKPLDMDILEEKIKAALGITDTKAKAS